MTLMHGTTTLLRQIRRLVMVQTSSQQTDGQLLDRYVAHRDEEAFATLLHRHGRMVLAVCRGVLHHQQDAEDVFQASFLVLARKAHTVRKQEAVSSWLHGVAYRLARKAQAQAAQRRRREAAVEPVPPATMDDLTLGELRAILHEELHRLPEKYLAPLLLCYWEGKTRDEAAQRLGMTAITLKKRLERARSLLRCRLTMRGLTPSVALFTSLLCDDVVKAALCPLLTKNTVQAAMAFAGGKGTCVGASAAALVLAEGAIRTMQLTKWATGIIALLIFGCVGTGLALISHRILGSEQPAAATTFIKAADDGPAPKKAVPPKTDAERIVGVWRVNKIRADGKDQSRDLVIPLMRLTFAKDGSLTMSVIDESKTGKYKLVGAGKIDVSLNRPEELEPSIYEFAGDNRLSICSSHGGQRPTEIVAEKGDKQVVIVLDRAKPGEEKPTAEEIAKFKKPLGDVREAAARAVSMNNIRQIALAMHNYHDTYGALPLHAIYSKDGKTPLLSWRVAILPYIEGAALYQQFKLDEPWDSEHNKKLIAKMPKVYEPVGLGTKEKGMTYYQVFTGPGTAFDGAKKIAFQAVTDGTSNTIMVVEAKDPVTWSKPDDLPLPKEKDKLPALGGLFKSGMNIGFMDGSARFVRPNLSPAVLRPFITINGGEAVDHTKLEPTK